MNYLDYISMDMEIWFLPKSSIVEKFWINYVRWSQLKSLGASWEPNNVPEWFLLLDSLAHKWNFYYSLNNNMEEFSQNLRDLLKKKRRQIINHVNDAVRESIKNNYFTVNDEIFG